MRSASEDGIYPYLTANAEWFGNLVRHADSVEGE